MHKPLRKFLAALLTLAMLVSLLPISAAPAQAAGEGESTGAFNVTKKYGQQRQRLHLHQRRPHREQRRKHHHLHGQRRDNADL